MAVLLRGHYKPLVRLARLSGTENRFKLYTAGVMEILAWLRRAEGSCSACDPPQSGKCAQCKGTGRTVITGVSCFMCHSTGRCRSCDGTGKYSSDGTLLDLMPDWIARFLGPRRNA
jgi:hypothetical protein